MSTKPHAPRVLFVDHVAELGGAELFLLDLARRYAGSCQVVLFEDGPFRVRLEAASVPVKVLAAPRTLLQATRGGGKLAGLAAVPAVLGLAARLISPARASEVVYANSQKAFVVGAFAAMLAGRPLVWYLHDLLTDEHFSPSRRWLVVTLANRFASVVLCNSEATAMAFKAAGGREALARVVPNGFDPTPFEAVDPTEVARLRAELSPPGDPLLGVFSRLAPWKGQHVLLKALPELPRARVVFVGDTLFGEESYGAHLRAEAEALGIADRVVFAGFRDDIPTLMQACDLILHTSAAAEPFGRVIVEGMLAGRAVVATNAGGAKEIICDGRTGRLVRPGDPSALAATIKDLLEHPIESDRLAAAGRVSAESRYSISTVVEAVTAEVAAVYHAAW